MASDISPANEQFIQQAIVAGRFTSRTEVLDAALSLLRDEAETLNSLRKGLASIERGEGIPLEEADQRLRAKHGMPRQG
jgi:Arc/MetJ-type ribon-helix-helix transcriptional regulator